MTTTANNVALIETADRGVIQFPTYCPSWCDRAVHLQHAVENAGLLTAADATAQWRGGGESSLSEIRNYVSHEVSRDGGGQWELTARQHLREPWTDHSGYVPPPLVELLVQDFGLGTRHQAFINLTTGEARVLAAHLVALCDAVDLPKGLQR